VSILCAAVTAPRVTTVSLASGQEHGVRHADLTPTGCVQSHSLWSVMGCDRLLVNVTCCLLEQVAGEKHPHDVVEVTDYYVTCRLG